jgi:hypothetical protein
VTTSPPRCWNHASARPHSSGALIFRADPQHEDDVSNHNDGDDQQHDHCYQLIPPTLERTYHRPHAALSSRPCGQTVQSMLLAPTDYT